MRYVLITLALLTCSACGSDLTAPSVVMQPVTVRGDVILPPVVVEEPPIVIEPPQYPPSAGDVVLEPVLYEP